MHPPFTKKYHHVRPHPLHLTIGRKTDLFTAKNNELRCLEQACCGINVKQHPLLKSKSNYKDEFYDSPSRSALFSVPYWLNN